MCGGEEMSSIIKGTIFSMMLFLLYPMTAMADIKIFINTPSYKYNPYSHKHYKPKYYSNNYHNKKYRHKKDKFNKYNFAPYSYRSNQYNYSHGNKKYYTPNNILRPSYSRIYNQNPYAHNYNRYQYQKEKAYWKGYRDGYNKQKRYSKFGK